MDDASRWGRAAPPPPYLNPLAADPGQTIGALVNRAFGGLVLAVESAPTVTTSVARLLQNNPRRVAWVLVNRSTSDGAIGFSAGLTFANGMPLPANGGSAVSYWERWGYEPAQELWAVQNSGSGTWRIVEYILQQTVG